MKLDLVLKELHRAENGLAHLLLRMSERHRTDHETYYVARDLAAWSRDHVRLLAEAGEGYGLELDPSPAGESTPVERMREKAAEWLGRRQEPGLLLLADFRHLYREAAGVSMDWELLAQAAQGARRRELLELARSCHPRTLRQLRWADSRLKDTATQVLVS
ncbi:hypothetical protein [Nonomuraea sp. NPDC050783]|uniref:hypothetical protein n=1 Tax=Nonomuraea sp. NPDC050783 TaxID=3154634 RepID=UPI003467DC02